MGEMFHIRRLLTLYGHIKTAEQRTIIQQTVIGTLAVDGWAVTFGTARRTWAGWVPTSYYCRAMLCISVAYAVMRCLCDRLCVCLCVLQVHDFCKKE